MGKHRRNSSSSSSDSDDDYGYSTTKVITTSVPTSSTMQTTQTTYCTFRVKIVVVLKTLSRCYRHIALCSNPIIRLSQHHPARWG